MRKFYIIILSLIMLTECLQTAYCTEKPLEKTPFNVYVDKNSKLNHFIPSGWMGDYGAVKLDTGYPENAHSGLTCIKIVYNAELPQGAGWVGVYWQNPENNWGSKDGGFNLSAATKLTFWAKGEKGDEKLEFKAGGVTGAYPDTDIASIGPVPLTKEWKKYEIDLKGLDFSYISGGFVWAASRMDNPYGFVIYIDDIVYE
ncbi:MAG: hypothetical protein V2A72_08550 [Candidatus Omnitrophota bacterium]